MFMYAGPVVETWVDCIPYANAYKGTRENQIEVIPCAPLDVLYTGDGDLGTAERAGRLISYLGESRVVGRTCLQVAHHGARRNWYRGLADRLAPKLSVFNSDPCNMRYRHPHGEVVRDFLRFSPIQVDSENGLMCQWAGRWR